MGDIFSFLMWLSPISLQFSHLENGASDVVPCAWRLDNACRAFSCGKTRILLDNIIKLVVDKLIWFSIRFLHRFSYIWYLSMYILNPHFLCYKCIIHIIVFQIECTCSVFQLFFYSFRTISHFTFANCNRIPVTQFLLFTFLLLESRKSKVIYLSFFLPASDSTIPQLHHRS